MGRRLAPLLLHGDRLRRFRSMSGEVVVHDLRRGIPAAAGSADAVYHSHVLEHLDREAVPAFLADVLRVLRPGGVHRIVVPDFEAACRRYISHLDGCRVSQERQEVHEQYIADIIEQMVRREASGTSRQRAIRRWLENRLLGDARKRGETHQWMYDEVTLASVLKDAGFRDVTVVDHRTSAIPRWEEIALDVDDQGRPHKPGSLYVEAFK